MAQIKNFTTPYNFIALSPWVYFPKWAEKVRLDTPLEEGISGCYELEIHTQTPLLVSEEKSAQERRDRLFITTPDGTKIIPGSSLKGAVSSLLETATFAKFRIQDKRLSLRDLSLKKDYTDKLNNEVMTGFLSFNQDEGWCLTKCDSARVSHEMIENHFKKKKYEFHSQRLVSKRYQMISSLIKSPTAPIAFSLDSNGNISLQKDGTEAKKGSLVFVGQVSTLKTSQGQSYNDLRGKASRENQSKLKEYIFFDEKTEHQIVPQQDINDFIFNHQKSDSWAFWERHKGNKVPVFYIKDNGHFRIGLSRLFRLGYKLSLYEALENTSKDHLDTSRLDFSELLFGTDNTFKVEKSSHKGLKGRINFSHFTVDKEVPTDPLEVVLASPKPSFYPAYINQPNAKSGVIKNTDYTTLMFSKAELKGRKRYPVSNYRDVLKTVDQELKQKGLPSPRKNKNISSKLHPVGKGSIFKGKVRFHNITPIELGAILWALTVSGKQDKYSLSLGMAKSYAFGQIKIAVKAPDVSFNNERNKLKKLTEYITLFTEHMEAEYKKQHVDKDAESWETSKQIKQLLAMCDVKYGNQVQAKGFFDYMPLAFHRDLKIIKKGFRSKDRAGLALQDYLEVRDQPFDLYNKTKKQLN